MGQKEEDRGKQNQMRQDGREKESRPGEGPKIGKRTFASEIKVIGHSSSLVVPPKEVEGLGVSNLAGEQVKYNLASRTRP